MVPRLRPHPVRRRYRADRVHHLFPGPIGSGSSSGRTGSVIPAADDSSRPVRYRGPVDTWLRSLAPDRVRRLPLNQTALFDTFLAVVLGAAAVGIPLSADEADLSSLTRPDGLWSWLLVVGAAWAIPFRRIAPLLAVVAGSIVQILVWTIGYPDSYISMAVLLYSAAAYGRPQRQIWVWLIAGTLTCYTGLGVLTSEDVPIYALPLVGLFSAAAVATGSNTQARQAYAEGAEARARELERSRQTDRERAKVEERARIARELHDVVAHGLSVIVVQAAAARRILERDPDGAATALGQIESTGRDALSEMRHVLSAIRTEPEDSWQPTRGLADLDDLVAELDRTGLPVTVHRNQLDDRAGEAESEGTGALEPLPATVDVTAYRIVQESLTNVLKHGGAGASAIVEITRRPGRLDLRVTDDGRGALADDGGGHGLRGMQERVDVFGGRLDAGPRLGGGYTVDVSLPIEVRSSTTSPADR